MRLQNWSVIGFRSLADVAALPVSNPTILAGPNDGGKTAALTALSFLVGEHTLIDDDRTFLAGEEGGRCASVEVIGDFTLDSWEQSTFGLPEAVRLRRVADSELNTSYEIWAALPDNEELRDLSSKLVADLKTLAKTLGIGVANPTKPRLLAALAEYGAKHSSTEGWTGAPPALLARLPRLASFSGRSQEPEEAIRSILNVKLKAYLEDETVRSELRTAETSARERLAAEAKPIADHIATRCGIAQVTVEPSVSATISLRGTALRLERSTGEAVRLDRSGQGSVRRIQMAIWESGSDLLAEPPGGDDEEGTPVQVIVVYDEPDTHLDYHFQRDVMRLIREQASIEHVSVVVATHSMNLIDGVDISDVVLLRLNEDRRTVAERLGSDSHEDLDLHLGVIAAAVGLRNSVLLHERCFLAVEGPSEQQAIPVLFQKSEGLSLQAAGIALWSCGGNDGALHLATYLVKHGRTVKLMVDGDSAKTNKMFNPTSLSTKFGTHYGDVVEMLGQVDGVDEFEELFDDEAWARTANAAWPRLSGEPWQAAHFHALRKEGKFSAKAERKITEESGATGKPAMMAEMAQRLERPDQVPGELRVIFAKLRKLAGHEPGPALSHV